MTKPSFPITTAYHRLILGHPRVVLSFLMVLFVVMGFQVKEFRLDASVDSLVLEHDEEFRYLRKILKRYRTGEFLVVTFTPQGDLFGEPSLKQLKSLRNDLRGLNRVASVVSMLDVPLMRSPPVPLKDLKSNIKTLEEAQEATVDMKYVRAEFKESPLFQNLIVSRDLKSTALQVNFAMDQTYFDLFDRRGELKEKKRGGNLSLSENGELEEVENAYWAHKALRKTQRHEDIAAVRKVMDKYRTGTRLFLGGVPMVVDDMISFVKRDLRVFGLGMLAFLTLTLSLIFKRIRWVILPILCCIFSVLVMIGLLGVIGWEVTVVSSNFISLQLIITMSFAIHIVVRYREILRNNPQAENREIVKETVSTIFVPCLYSCLTTIAGFSSLLICDILPIVDFGWMMTMGLGVSLVTTFLLFPTSLILLKKAPYATERNIGGPITGLFARITENHGKWVIGLSVVVAIVTCIGISRLDVENSFIDYFKKDTEIYRGMKIIDEKLGGTTPLDITLEFGENANNTNPVEPDAFSDDDFEMFDEFEEEEDPEKYWYTTDKMAVIESVHDYLESLPAAGKVLSLATLLKTTRALNDGKPFDNFDLAVLFSSLPEQFRGILINPYVSIGENQARISMRIKDSLETLRRDAFIKEIQNHLSNELGLSVDRFHLTGIMVLYNNMLQSLYNSQIRTIGLTVIFLMIMFMMLFRSVKISLIAIFPNLLASLVILGVMGLAGIPLDVMTITIVAISVGIAVDNTIHYIFRFRREFLTDKNYLATMFRCHASIGNAMFYTSLTIIVGFSILALSNFVPTILFGVLTALAMTMALCAALTLLPRLIILFKPFGEERT